MIQNKLERLLYEFEVVYNKTASLIIMHNYMFMKFALEVESDVFHVQMSDGGCFYKGIKIIRTTDIKKSEIILK